MVNVSRMDSLQWRLKDGTMITPNIGERYELHSLGMHVCNILVINLKRFSEEPEVRIIEQFHSEYHEGTESGVYFSPHDWVQLINKFQWREW